jgi:hypothetical protein
MVYVSLSTRLVYIVPLAGANRTRREPAAQTSRFLPARRPKPVIAAEQPKPISPAERLQRVVAVLVRPGPRSQRPTLSIPLSKWFTPEALSGAKLSAIAGRAGE